MPAAGPSKTATPKAASKTKTATPKSGKKARAPSIISDSGSEVDDTPSASESEGASEERPVVVRRGKGGLASYQPPPGMEAVSVSVQFKTSPVEFDALANKPGVEVWAIRVPSELRATRLSALTLSKPKSGSVKGSLATKGGNYILEGAGGEPGAPGAEMDGLSLMVPHLSRGGRLYRAPVNITRRLLLSPAAPAASEDGFVAPVKRKREQPAHLLKFRNRAFGFDTAGHAATVVDASGASEAGHEDKDDVEMEEEEAPAPMAIAIPSSDARKQRERSRTDTDKSKSKKSDESPAKKKKKSKD